MINDLITLLKSEYPSYSINGGYGVKDIEKVVSGSKEYFFVNYIGENVFEDYTKGYIKETNFEIVFSTYSDPENLIEDLQNKVKLDGKSIRFLNASVLNESVIDKNVLHKFYSLWGAV